MKKHTIFLAILAVLFLTGCSLTGSSTDTMGGVLKSTDGGTSWELRVKIDDKSNVSSVDVLSMAVGSKDSSIIYIGTLNDGIFVSKSGAENWTKINFPPIKIYGLALDSQNDDRVFVTGVWGGRGKIYKSENGGADWDEIYTEPANGTVVISLAIDKNDSQVLYAGTSEGIIMKTNDGGISWRKIYSAQGPVTGISFDAADRSTVYFLVLEKELLLTKDGGRTVSGIVKNMEKLGKGSGVTALQTDPSVGGIVYAGLKNGLARSSDYGENWENINILNSSQNFPIQYITANPLNSRELIYSTAQAVYKSVDGGVQWSTFQLETKKIVGTIKYDALNPSDVYLGLKKGR